MIEIAGTYGGQFYCFVKANKREDAVRKAKARYPSNNMDDYDFKMIPYIDEIEITFDEDGISPACQYSW